MPEKDFIYVTHGMGSFNVHSIQFFKKNSQHGGEEIPLELNKDICFGVENTVFPHEKNNPK